MSSGKKGVAWLAFALNSAESSFGSSAARSR